MLKYTTSAIENKCLPCHGVRVEDKKLLQPTFKLEEGVSCVVCHGPYLEWVEQHGGPRRFAPSPEAAADAEGGGAPNCSRIRTMAQPGQDPGPGGRLPDQVFPAPQSTPSENQTDGSLSSVTFKRAGAEPAGDMTIEYLSGNGFGRFVRR